MPNNILLSGPAAGGKSQLSRDLIREATAPTVQADFQSVVVALLGLERSADGSYPVRPEWILGLAEAVRQSIVDLATAREISIVLTNSDGSPARRAALLERLGPGPGGGAPEADGGGAAERIIDPGEAAVRARLTDPKTGVLSADCEKAIARWFGRVGR